jgi:hypothetical protein
MTLTAETATQNSEISLYLLVINSTLDTHFLTLQFKSLNMKTQRTFDKNSQLAIVSPDPNSAAITLVSSATETPSEPLVHGHSGNDPETGKEAADELESSEADQEV